MIRSNASKLSCALVSSCLCAGVAHAEPDPVEIAQQCVLGLTQITQATGEDIAQAAGQGATLIVALDDNGAPDAVLVGAARNTQDTINAQRAQGVNQAEAATKHCVRVLRALDAPRPLIAFVINAKQNAVGVMRGADLRATAGVNAVLRHELND